MSTRAACGSVVGSRSREGCELRAGSPTRRRSSRARGRRSDPGSRIAARASHRSRAPHLGAARDRRRPGNVSRSSPVATLEAPASRRRRADHGEERGRQVRHHHGPNRRQRRHATPALEPARARAAGKRPGTPHRDARIEDVARRSQPAPAEPVHHDERPVASTPIAREVRRPFGASWHHGGQDRVAPRRHHATEERPLLARRLSFHSTGHDRPRALRIPVRRSRSAPGGPGVAGPRSTSIACSIARPRARKDGLRRHSAPRRVPRVESAGVRALAPPRIRTRLGSPRSRV